MNRSEFYATFGPLCQAYGEHYGLPPVIMLAQIAIESGWGKHPAPGTKNNYVGMKWTSGQWKRPAREVNALEGQNTDNERLEKARFVEFASPEHCVGYLAETLAFSSHYAGFRKAVRDGKPIDLITKALAKNYTTDVRYPAKVQSVIGTIERSECWHLAKKVSEA